jgi:hypothetical protein
MAPRSRSRARKSKRKLSAYNKFVKSFASSHKGQFRSGKSLMKAAAKAYKSGKSPKSRSRSRRSRR